MFILQETEKKFLEKLTYNNNLSNQFIKNIQINLPLKPVITKKQLKNPSNSNLSINSLLSKKPDPISAQKKLNTNIIASTLIRKTSAKSEKVSINCDESIETKNSSLNKTNKEKSSNIKKNKKVNLSINLSKSLGSFHLFDDDNIPSEENSIELGLNSAIEKQKAEKYKPLKTFLSEVNMPDLFINFAKKDIFTNEQIENLSDYDLKGMQINESDRKKMLDYVKELKMRRELSVEGDFGTQCDSKYYCNDPVTDNIEEYERIQSELFKKAVEEFRNRNKDPKDIKENNNIKEEMPQVDKSMKSLTTNISENNNNVVINPKNFLLEIGNSDVLNLNNLSLFANAGNDMNEDIENDPDLKSTQACWNCFKIMDVEKGIGYEDRLFCSDKCVEKYKKKSDIKCSFCHKNFLKFNGFISGEKIFCSAKCYRDDKNTIKEIEGGEDNEEDEDENEKNTINNDKNANNEGKENIEDDPIFSNEIDILDI